ncbi:hypothetical protein [Pleionea sp. CnH1-48]|uniref:hypothetical protein n=1 Tax=Pleionea sp. CnH1-48 TaxID=2954494 RepID=UPI0020984874|nr:hypothetical protein [Pleionea sp. CnH1-48]MCO7226976.1 hypothetical protein [Pleionea sp. CnH1-48]
MNMIVIYGDQLAVTLGDMIQASGLAIAIAGLVFRVRDNSKSIGNKKDEYQTVVITAPFLLLLVGGVQEIQKLDVDVGILMVWQHLDFTYVANKFRSSITLSC